MDAEQLLLSKPPEALLLVGWDLVAGPGGHMLQRGAAVQGTSNHLGHDLTELVPVAQPEGVGPAHGLPDHLVALGRAPGDQPVPGLRPQSALHFYRSIKYRQSLGGVSRFLHFNLSATGPITWYRMFDVTRGSVYLPGFTRPVGRMWTEDDDMALTITEVHRRGDDKELNDEWFVVENSTEAAINTRGCRVTLTKGTGKKAFEVAKLDPGFKVDPGGKVRVVCGRPGTKAHGKAPEDDLENYFLLMKVPLFKGQGGVLKVAKGQLVLASFEITPP